MSKPKILAKLILNPNLNLVWKAIRSLREGTVIQLAREAAVKKQIASKYLLKLEEWGLVGRVSTDHYYLTSKGYRYISFF